MSQYLAPYFLDIPLGYTILQTQNRLVGHFTDNGWQLLAQVDDSYSDLIPPATETIGTTKFREVVRLYFPNNTTITIGSYQVCIADAYPQSIRLTAKTAGAVAAAVTIDGVTVTGAVGSAGSTANDNLRALYYALRDSANATITGWGHDYNGTDTIICTNKTIGAMVACSGNANVTYSPHAASVLAGARSGFVIQDAANGYSVPMDLTQGFVYYMEIYSRSFSLSTKTLGGTTGQVFASYIDHSEAMAVMPDSPFCTPIELVIGSAGESGPVGRGRLTHWWAIPSQYANHTIPSQQTTYKMADADPTPEFNPWTGAANPRVVTDAPLNYTGYSYSLMMPEQTLSKLGLVSGPSAINGAFRVTPLGFIGSVYVFDSNSGANPAGGYANSARFLPAFNLPDINKWTGTEPDETSAMSRVQPPPSSYPTLAQALDTTTAYSSITLSSTAGLSATGGDLIIGMEQIHYTGISGANVTGVSMAQNGTVRERHFIGDVVSPVVWFLKINNGAICCGPTKPV